MNSAKKIMKNQGLAKDSGRRAVKSEPAISRKNLVLLVMGLAVMLVLCLGVCYIELRPRPVLVVEGKDADGSKVINKVNYKEAMHDIYTVETQYNSMEALYTQIYGSSFWEYQNADNAGRNGAQLAKKEIMDGLKKREILCMEAKKANVALSEEEKSKVEEDLKNFRNGLSSAQKKMMGLDEKTVRTVLQKQALADKYRDQVIAGLGIDEEALKASVSKKDYRQYTLQYYTFEKNNTDEKGNSVKKSDDVVKKAKEDMEALQKRAAAGKDFTKDVIADSNGDSVDDQTGISYKTEDLLETDTDFMTKKARKLVKAMKNNEISDVIETKDAYFVVKMVNNNDPKAYDEQCTQVVENEKETQFNTKYKNEIKVNYTAKAQSYWKKRVTVGYLTYDPDAQNEE